MGQKKQSAAPRQPLVIIHYYLLKVHRIPAELQQLFNPPPPQIVLIHWGGGVVSNVIVLQTFTEYLVHSKRV